MLSSVVALMLFASQAAVQSREVNPATISRDFTTFTPTVIVSPNSLAELVKRSEVVVAAVVSTARMLARASDNSPEMPIIETLYTVRVVDVLKPTRPVDHDVDVVVVGGSVQGGRLLPIPDERAFKPGDELLLFLEWSNSQDAYEIVAGMRGAYDLSSSVARMVRPGDSPLRHEVESQRAEDLKQTIRLLALK